jgi:hypothetical protein
LAKLSVTSPWASVVATLDRVAAGRTNGPLPGKVWLAPGGRKPAGAPTGPETGGGGGGSRVVARGVDASAPNSDGISPPAQLHSIDAMPKAAPRAATVISQRLCRMRIATACRQFAS